MPEFVIDRIEPDGLVVGRNSQTDIPLNTVFTKLKRIRLEHAESLQVGDIVTIGLQLTEISFYQRTIEVIPGGHTAGIRLEGSGLEDIADALATKRNGEFLSIST
ncbi:hypothetical protein [Achromobacter marplatensis]|uniref:hypothetical protein n=1 Tax=Achromobacter marplatensis TaxID=470868 RepID=UPI0028E40E4C|nr:hypothetical protein [Achromobacter marplatensis]